MNAKYSFSPSRTAQLLGALALAACSDAGPVVYTAQAYDADAECRSAYQPIGLVEATELRGDCPATCLDVGGTLYVSTGCPPFPLTATELLPSEDLDCATALASPDCD